MWPMMRIGAMVQTMPVIGTRMVPVRIKIMLGFVLSVTAIPLLPPVPAVEVLSLDGLMIAFQQVLIGAAMGFMLQLVFGALDDRR